MELTNNTILITGGSSGYGFELAKQLLEKGNKVIICGRAANKLEKAQTLLPDVHTFICDISEAEDRKALYQYLKQEHADLNVLINNAAEVYAYKFEFDNDVLQKMEREINTNYIAPMALSKSILPQLVKNENPMLVNINTGLTLSPKAKYPGYCASKAALHSVLQTIRMQMQGSRLKIVEVILPVVDTPFHKGNVPKKAISAQQAVNETIAGLEKGQVEIKVGMVKFMAKMARFAPKFVSKKVNAM